MDTELSEPPRFTVEFSPAAQEHATWLMEKWTIDYTARLVELLSRDPSPHRTRRIKRRASGQFEIGCGAWRAVFEVHETLVTIQALEPAYPLRFLTREGSEMVPDCAAQLAFLDRWPSPSSDVVRSSASQQTTLNGAEKTSSSGRD